MHQVINFHFIQGLDHLDEVGVGNIFNCPLTSDCDLKLLDLYLEKILLIKLIQNLI